MEILMHISDPLIDSVETIKKRAKSTSFYELVNLAGAIRLYEKGKRGFYFPDVRSTVKNEIAKNKMDLFNSFSKLYAGFDNLIKGGTLVPDPTGRKKYMLNKEIQGKLDEILQNQSKPST